jgi:hypothetical protein
MRKQSIVVSGIIMWFVLNTTYSQSEKQVFETPFIVSQTGQIIIQAQINNSSRDVYFYYETDGSHKIRKDQNHILSDLDVSVDEGNTLIEKLSIGGKDFYDVKFSFSSNLLKRGKLAFPPVILGTIGNRLFDGMVVQIDYKNYMFRIAPTHKLLNISDDAVKIPFRSSFATKAIALEVESRLWGTKELIIDTRSPVGIHYFFSDLNYNQRTKYGDSMKKVDFKLDGENPLLFGLYNDFELFIEDYWVLKNETIWFSDYLPNSIGNGFLQHFIVTVDFRNNMLYFEPIDKAVKNIDSGKNKD